LEAINDNRPPHFTSAELALPMTRHSADESYLRGIYFLFKDGELVYIGQSKNVLSRISAHKSAGIVFDEFAYRLCERHELNRLEAAYTALHRPKLNFHADGYILGPETGTHMEQIFIDGKRAYEPRPGYKLAWKAGWLRKAA
jgi:hypothetical protein